MKIILTQDVVNLGEEGDVRVVKDGYARNYLLPTGAAVIYNKTNEAIFKSRAAQIEKRTNPQRDMNAQIKPLSTVSAPTSSSHVLSFECSRASYKNPVTQMATE